MLPSQMKGTSHITLYADHYKFCKLILNGDVRMQLVSLLSTQYWVALECLMFVNLSILNIHEKLTSWKKFIQQNRFPTDKRVTSILSYGSKQESKEVHLSNNSTIVCLSLAGISEEMFISLASYLTRLSLRARGCAMLNLVQYGHALCSIFINFVQFGDSQQQLLHNNGHWFSSSGFKVLSRASLSFAWACLCAAAWVQLQGSEDWVRQVTFTISEKKSCNQHYHRPFPTGRFVHWTSFSKNIQLPFASPIPVNKSKDTPAAHFHACKSL